jgi:Lon-like ATP-dependent protease
VRNLRKHLEKVYRKAALKLVTAGARLVGGGEGTPGGTSDSSSSSSSTAAGSEPSSSSEGGGTEGDAGTPSSTSSSEDSSSSSGSSESAPGSPSDTTTTTTTTTSSSSSASPEQPQVEYSGEPITIGPGDLKEYVGIPPFAKDRFYDTTPPGVVMGLAWTALGGATLYVEAAPVVEVGGEGGRLCLNGVVWQTSSSVQPCHVDATCCECIAAWST